MVHKIPHAILSWDPESEESYAHFYSIPWTSRILSAPGVRCMRCAYRHRLPLGWDPVANGVLRKPAPVLASEFSFGGEGGIIHYLSAIGPPDVSPMLWDSSSDDEAQIDLGTIGIYSALTGSRPGPQSQASEGFKVDFPQHLDFYTLTSSLTGLPNTLHGGITALLIDSAFAKLGMMHASALVNSYAGPEGQFYSAYTNVAFQRPIVLDAAGKVNVVVKAQIDGTRTKEGDRKIYVLASVEGEKGIVFANGEGLLVERVWDGAKDMSKL